MKKVMIYAYTNFNLGDDLFIKILVKRYPNVKFILYAPKNYKRQFININNLKVYSNRSLISRTVNFISRLFKSKKNFELLLAESCDLCVYIGGSLFMQVDNWRKAMEYKEKLHMKNKPFFLLGANFGPFKDEEFYLNYKRIFENYTDICFRDSYSYELFKDMKNVRLAADMVFNLTDEVINQNKSNNIVISVIKPSYRSSLSKFDMNYYRKIKDIIVYSVKRNYNVTLMSFCKNEGDEEAVNEIINLLPTNHGMKKKVQKYYYRKDIQEALNIISSSKMVIGTRFHSMILGWLYNKPVFPIIYNEKMLNVIKDIGFNGKYLDIKNINELNSIDILSSIKTEPINVSNQVKNSEKQFEKLDDYLFKN